MSNVILFAPFVKKWEGDFSNDPLDSGGATMHGITLYTFKVYCRAKRLPVPTVQDLKNISDEMWLDVLKTMFWDRWKADLITNQSVANLLVDFVWASGKWGIKIPQRVLGVQDDGIVGNITLSTLNKKNQKEFFDKVWGERVKFLQNIVKNNPTQKRFIKGWINRINDLKFSTL